MTTTPHPGAPRDVDLAEWLNAAGFHPADTLMKQMGHEAARTLVGLLGKHLHRLVPASREKSIIFSHLEQVRHYANQALAVHGGPPPSVDATDLAALLDDLKRIAAQIGAELPEDARINEYKAGHDEGENRREAASVEVNDPEVLEEFAAGFLAAANRLRRARA